MSFSVQRHKSDQRRLGKFSKPLLALVDMIADGDWERVIDLAETIATEARVEAMLAELKHINERKGT